MKLEVIHLREPVGCAAIGAVAALLFLFVFPAGSISTLMHAVLKLPGPGAGIAVVLGPYLILVAVLASRLMPVKGVTVLVSLTFAITYALVARVLGIATNPKGAFGTQWFVLAAGVFGLAAEVVLAFGKALREPWRCVAAGTVSNAVLVIFYWLVIFPRTAGWVRWRDVPILIGLCLVCGLASAYIAWRLSRSLTRPLARKEET